MLRRLAFVEHVLGEAADVLAAGDRDAARVMEHERAAERVREGHGVARALVVDAIAGRIVHVHVVDGGEVEKVVDLALELLQVGRADQAFSRDVAGDHVQAVGGLAEALLQRLELVGRGFAHQHVDRGVLAREQALEQELADETGGTGDEVVHGVSKPKNDGRGLAVCFSVRGLS